MEILRIWLRKRAARVVVAMKTPILVCFAVPEEAKAFRHQFPVGVDVLVTGMGRGNAERALRARIAQKRPELVLTCGFAGGLNPQLSRGAVVFSADAEAGVAADLKKHGAAEGKIHCAPRVATTAQEKAALRESTGADAVEMESHFMREICRSEKIPSATVRVISDAAHEDLPLDFNALMTPEQNLDFGKLAKQLVFAPWKIPSLMRLQRRTRAAADNLAHVLVELLRPRVEV